MHDNFQSIIYNSQIWKQPKCPPKDKWIKMGPVCVYTQIHTHTHTHTHTMGYYSGTEYNEILPCATTWMNLFQLCKVK